MSTDDPTHDGRPTDLAAFAHNELTTYDPHAGVMFAAPAVFDRAWRLSGILKASRMVPDDLSREGAFLALDIAQRTGQSPLAVCQSLYLVHGRWGWTSSYLIARARQLGHTIRWRVDERGEAELAWRKSGKNEAGKASFRLLTVTAYLLEDETCTAEVTTEMAHAEGWLSNPKYRSMLRRMLQFRAATFLVRDFLPDVLFALGGAPTDVELDTMEPEVLEVVGEDPAPGPEGLSGALGQAPSASEASHDQEGVTERRKLRAQISEATTRLTVLDEGGVERVRVRTGIRALRDTSPIERFEAYLAGLHEEIRALEDIGEGERREAIMTADPDDTQPKDPEDMNLGVTATDRRAYLDNVYMMEGAFEPEVRTAIGASCQLPEDVPVWRLSDNDLAGYAHALYARGWGML